MASSPDAGAFVRLRAAIVARLQPHDNWLHLLKHAWSVRLALLAAVLSGAEVVCAVFTDNPPIERGTFAALAGTLTVLAAIARLFAQSTISGDSA